MTCNARTDGGTCTPFTVNGTTCEFCGRPIDPPPTRRCERCQGIGFDRDGSRCGLCDGDGRIVVR